MGLVRYKIDAVAAEIFVSLQMEFHLGRLVKAGTLVCN